MFSLEIIHKAQKLCILLSTATIWPNEGIEQLGHTLYNDYKGRLHAGFGKPIENSIPSFGENGPKSPSFQITILLSLSAANVPNSLGLLNILFEVT